MWSLAYPNITQHSNCDYSLQPLNWETPIVVVNNWLSPAEVTDCLTKIEANKKHAICNMSYSSSGDSTAYAPNFRRSADLNSKFISKEIWKRKEADMLRYAVENYGATYAQDQKILYGHSFITVYRAESGYLGMHSDAGHLNLEGSWRASVTTRYEMTGLVYLSTEGVDFNGGLIQFPYIKNENGEIFQYRAKAGDAVFFPCNPVFAHEVTESQGNRIILGAWRGWRPFTFTE